MVSHVPGLSLKLWWWFSISIVSLSLSCNRVPTRCAATEIVDCWGKFRMIKYVS